MNGMRTMTRAEWPGVPGRGYAFSDFSFMGLAGQAGLFYMRTVTEPMRVSSMGDELYVVKQGYSWLQLAPENERFWATVMFDENGELFQYYFDITRENTVLPQGQSSFIDLYLDIIMRPGGQIALIDEDDLNAALECGEIDQSLFCAAHDAARRLIGLIEGREAQWRAYCANLRQKLLDRLYFV